MTYTMEQLLPIVTELSIKYTSNESSSITYETAQMLMRAVLYTMKEADTPARKNTLQTNTEINIKALQQIYQQGCNAILEKVLAAKKLYHHIIGNYYDFGCLNYRDTIVSGIPEFFRRYEPVFKPQDHLLTLDYPSAIASRKLCGVDLIYQYLFRIDLENGFLALFDTAAVEDSLERLLPDYRNLYLGNICEQVLLCCIGCFIAERPLANLSLTENDLEEITFYFQGDSLHTIESKISNIIGIIISQLAKSSALPNARTTKLYFMGLAHNYAFRIQNGMKHNTLSQIFSTS